jgi:hypothetical protein
MVTASLVRKAACYFCVAELVVLSSLLLLLLLRIAYLAQQQRC